MLTNLEIICIEDQDSYKSLWVNGENLYRSTDSLLVEDIFHLIQDIVEKNGGIQKMVVHTFSLDDVGTSDIPENLNTLEELQAWHVSQTGQVMSDGM